jgi:hypothetical protein
MNRLVAMGVVLAFLVGSAAVWAWDAAPVAPCLTDAQLEGNKALFELRRPTTKDDPEWFFNPDYFLGAWDLDWDAPDSILGSAGKVTGKLIFKHIEACYYEGELKEKGPDGPIEQRVQFVADPGNKWMTWIETDRRGFLIIKSGRMGGDLGGYFTHFWEAPVFTYRGRKVRIKGTNFLGSPAAFRCREQISIDCGPYENFGTLWFRKDLSTGVPNR